ncbi:MAG: class IV adenylate cyclase [Candidatus Methanoperedens sp.]|nr:class IV adenylate cyclase [Candidatus Methanoperedens sp.]MCE8425076.1 class IV adenylate cyclase [Candidatus Methanoperedens sp.]MCE8427731.1 class IV adenylate cyclase [Candidatus Methanoperedens sp.]
MIEVEVKACVKDPRMIERSIVAMGAAPIGIENQADTYYNGSGRDFVKTDEALRIRAKDNKYFLTYKGPKLDKISKTRQEFEVEINDPSNMGNILSSLGFSPVGTVIKKRKNYRIGDFFISLDEVRNLGTFIEIEIAVKDSRNYDEKVESIFKFIEKLDMNRESTIRESYLEMLLQKDNLNE